MCGEEASGAVSVSGAVSNTSIKIPVFGRDGLDQCSELRYDYLWSVYLVFIFWRVCFGVHPVLGRYTGGGEFGVDFIACNI